MRSVLLFLLDRNVWVTHTVIRKCAECCSLEKSKWLCEYRAGRLNSLGKSGKIAGVTAELYLESLAVLQRGSPACQAEDLACGHHSPLAHLVHTNLMGTYIIKRDIL